MNINEHKAMAKKMESEIAALLGDFNQTLQKHGFGGLKVVSFSVGQKAEESRLHSFAGTPCPTKCKPLPDGQIECRPDCS